MSPEDKQQSPPQDFLSVDLVVALMGRQHTVSDIPTAPYVGRLDYKNAEEWMIAEMGVTGKDLYCGSSSGTYIIVSDLGNVDVPYEHFDGDSEESTTRVATHLMETIKERIRKKRDEPLDEAEEPLEEKLSFPLLVCLVAPQYTVGVFPTAPLVGTLPDLDHRPLHLQISSWDYKPIIALDEVVVPKELIRRSSSERVHDGFQPEEGVDYTKKQYPLENYLMKTLKERIENYKV